MLSLKAETMIKPLSICAAALLLVGCNQAYPSLKQARAACFEWREKYDLDKDRVKVSKQRHCELERETNQYLGTEEGEVVKHFRYY